MSIPPLAILWLVLVLVFVGVEAATVCLVSIWFAVGAIAAFLTTFFTSSFTLQLCVFVLASALSLYFTRPLVRKCTRTANEPTNAERNIGRTATVIQTVTPERLGRVRLDGVDWSATASTTLEKGTLCTVSSINSTVLFVTPQETPQHTS